jgi:hypothetical protein
MDPDPDSDADTDPAIFVINLRDANKKTNLKKSFSAYYFLKARRYQQVNNSSICRRYQKHGLPTFWCGSGSDFADPCLCGLMDPDPDSDADPAIFVIDLQDANKK